MAKRSVIDQLPEAVRHEFERKLVENGFADYQDRKSTRLNSSH